MMDHTHQYSMQTISCYMTFILKHTETCTYLCSGKVTKDWEITHYKIKCTCYHGNGTLVLQFQLYEMWTSNPF